MEFQRAARRHWLAQLILRTFYSISIFQLTVQHCIILLYFLELFYIQRATKIRMLILETCANLNRNYAKKYKIKY